MLKNSPWKKDDDQPGGSATFDLVSLSVSLLRYVLSNAGDQPDGYPGSNPTGNLGRGHIERKRGALNFVSLYSLDNETKTGPIVNRRSVLEYVQFGHTTGQCCSLWFVLIYGGLLTSQRYYHNPEGKPDKIHILAM